MSEEFPGRVLRRWVRIMLERARRREVSGVRREGRVVNIGCGRVGFICRLES